MRKNEVFTARTPAVSSEETWNRLNPSAKEWLAFREANGREGTTWFRDRLVDRPEMVGEARATFVMGNMTEFVMTESGVRGTTFNH